MLCRCGEDYERNVDGAGYSRCDLCQRSHDRRIDGLLGSREGQAKQRASRKQAGPRKQRAQETRPRAPKPKATHCKYGHEYTGWTKGTARCETCYYAGAERRMVARINARKEAGKKTRTRFSRRKTSSTPPSPPSRLIDNPIEDAAQDD